MSTIRLGPEPSDFIWGSGVEDTFVPQTKPGHRALDEYELMGHYEHWREDLALARDLGVQALRWGVPWYRVEPRQGDFDWRWIDEVLPYLVEELGITPIVDLMHYGCPFWLEREFASDAYPDTVALYAAAFARRYAGLAHWYTPLNEPLVNALMCGQRGLWPPYLRGDRGYVRILLQLVKGILNTVEAIRAVDSQVVMVHVDAAGMIQAALEELRPLAEEDQLRNYLPYDLLTGRVTSEHPLFAWLVRNGAPLDELAEIARRRIALDVMGLNFYPQWSTKELYLNEHGQLAYRLADKEGSGFGSMLAQYFRRYSVPITITETSARGSEWVRARWLQASLTAIRERRGQGVPVLGYTWFPMFTMIDWRYRFGRLPVERYRLELGLYTLNDDPTGPRWRPTPLVEQLRDAIHHPEETIGHLAR